MTQTLDLIEVVVPLTETQLQAGLLDLSGDLDKAAVLRTQLPPWMVTADADVLAALEQAHRASERPRARLNALLERLRPLDEYCAERLHAYLASKGVDCVDVQHDVLEVSRYAFRSVMPDLTWAQKQTPSVHKATLLQAAMQNFPASQATVGGVPESALIRSAASGKPLPDLSVLDFVTYCRELDLGQAYQRHLCEVFKLPARTDHTHEQSLSANSAAMTVGTAKCLDMEVDLHLARARQHISTASYTRVLELIRTDWPASEVEHLAPEDAAMIWQSLEIDGATLWSVLLLSTDTPGSLPGGAFLLYMPNEPERAWYEYSSLQDFQQYLTRKLQESEYRRFFQRYLDEEQRPGFLARFDKAQTLGSLATVVVKVRFSAFFFHACLSKIQRDAQVLAVPVAEVDAQASEERLQTYLSAGLTLLNVAGFVVPVLGQLMAGVAVGQLLGEVFDGVEDWAHHRTADALKHLSNVGQSLAAMAAFAVGGRIVGALWRGARSSDFFEQVEAVTRQNGQPGLWRRSLGPYRQTSSLDDKWVTNPYGIYQAQGQSYIRIDGEAYAIGFDPALGKWRINHPTRPTAFRPPLEHNKRGGWLHIYEQPEQWQDLRYTLNRLDPSLRALEHEQVESIAEVSDMSLPKAQRLALDHQPLPARFNDSVLRFKQQQKIVDLIAQMERQQPSTPQTAYTQLLALPLVPGWPKGRFFELLDEQGDVLESHPDLAPFDYEDQSIHITRQQLDDGQLMETLLEELDEQEQASLLGQAARPAQAKALLQQRLLDSLKANPRPVYEQLYLRQEYQGAVAQMPFKRAFPEMPSPLVRELMAQATDAERRLLAQTGRVPLTLAQRARETLDELAQDQAVMGLHAPELATDASHRVALGVMRRLPGWPQELLLYLREGRAGEQVSAPPGEPAVQRIVLKTAAGYQALDAQGQSLGATATGPEGFYTAVLNALSARQRAALNLDGPSGAARLRALTPAAAREERPRLAGYLWPERAKVASEEHFCVQAAPPSLTSFARELVRKLRKLYPSLTDVQLSTLLEEAGTDHLSRAKAVQALEQQFDSLHRALKTWRNDLSAYNLMLGTRQDFRLSRAQVATALERCWRRMTVLPNKARVNVPGLSLNGMLRAPLPMLPAGVSFAHVEQLTLRNTGQTDDVAYFLKHFPGLHAVDLADNQISRLPEVLSKMPRLEDLCLANNNLQLTEYTRKTLGAMRTLHTLNLSQNPLRDPPEVRSLFDLRELLLRDCRLTRIPPGAARLPYLHYVDLRENDIKVLPGWLFQLPRASAQAFNLRHNPLDTSSRQTLRNYRNDKGLGMGYLEDDIARLTEQKARELWLADDRVNRYTEKLRLWNGFKDEPTSDGLFNLLAELGGTADAALVREDMDRRVWRVLEAVGNDAQLREQVYERAATPLNCDDAAAVSFSNLEVLVEIREAERLVEDGKLTAKPLLDLAKSLFRLDQLERLAYNHSLAHPEADPLEVNLAFRSGLANTLQLPGQPRHMRFASLAGVTPSDLTDAANAVRAAELSPKLLQYLVELPFWSTYLKRTFAGRFERINQPFDRRLQRVFDTRETLDDAAYHKQVTTIHKEQAQAEQAELESQTQSALKYAEVGGCLEVPLD